MADHQMEQFIRAKYEQKRYMLPNFVYPRVDVNDLPKPGQPITKHKTTATTSLTSSTNVRVPAAAAASSTTKQSSAVVNDLLDFSSPASPSNQANGDNSLAGDLASLSLASEQVFLVDDTLTYFHFLVLRSSYSLRCFQKIMYG
ncbi:hypothetical protein ANCCEY_03297 [Ancylostoma ceylanicum]|uniref:Uncharacterized protein n=1 Tax=Ancylostoma ceylanicum TaxID=53326 RepID=A0A0D6M003_9BILA|nr:hypothetical protein ANCCEY_03297 [Ancylostoma ceylanicum]